MFKKFLCLGLIIIMTATQAVPALADREDDLRQERAATNNQLETKQGQIWTYEQKTQELQAEINQADAQLVDVLVAIEVLKDDITRKEAEIVQTAEELKKAEADRDRQYEAMKIRIQHIYENGGDTAWAQILLESGDLSTMLSKAEYTQSIHDYDRERLDEYISTIKQVKALGERLAEEKSELEVMKAEQETQQAALEQLLAEKKAANADYKNRIEVASAQARELKNLLAAQTAEISRIQEAKRKAAEEAARRAAAAEAARRREAEAAAARSNASSASSRSSSSSSRSSSGSGESGNDDQVSSSSGGGDNSGASTGAAHSGRGGAVVSYATQFVGNPYVWGGTSLTNGADCSGFIMSVFANFGVSLPRTSGGMRGAGVGVSYSEAKPGDIICYSGHVAIYMGGGSIVHASSPSTGIKISGNAAYRTILAVRRVI
jgi:Cell wall-associated hydrolases (invasion-associated proteins)